jgi:uncharacterized membrane-anchored protein YhcB (DUF1043 family)
MIDTGEALRLILAALALGVTIPVLVQLFLTLRQIQRMTRQVEPGLRILNQIAERQQESQTISSAPAPQLAAILAALVPTLIAAYQAVRHHQAQTSEPSAPSPSQGRESNPTRESREKES